MARKSKPYEIQLHNGSRKQISRAEWDRLLARGLADRALTRTGEPSQRLAIVREGARISEVAGRLHVTDAYRQPVGAPMATYAAIVDQQWVFSGAGKSPIPPRIEAEIRREFGADRHAEAEAYLRMKRREWRPVLVAEQFGIPAQVVI